MKNNDSMKRFQSAVAGMNDLRLQIEISARTEQIQCLNRRAEENKKYERHNSGVEKEREDILEQLKILSGELRRRLSSRSFEDKMQKRGIR